MRSRYTRKNIGSALAAGLSALHRCSTLFVRTLTYSFALPIGAFIVLVSVIGSPLKAEVACTLSYEEVMNHWNNTHQIVFDYSQAREGKLVVINNTSCGFSVIGQSGEVVKPTDEFPHGVSKKYWLSPSTYIQPNQTTVTAPPELPTCNFQIDWSYGTTLDLVNKGLTGQRFEDRGYCEYPVLADLKLEKTVYNPSVTKKGTRVTFILRVTNLRADAASGVEIKDAIPAGITFDSNPQHSSPFCSVTNNQVVCAIGTIQGNASRDAVVSFLIPLNYQPGVCPATVRNFATVYTTTRETDYLNNAANATQPVPCPEPVCPNGQVEEGEQCDDGNGNDADACTNTCELPRSTDIKLVKTVLNQAAVKRGQWVPFNFKVTNATNVPAQNVKVVDNIPPGLTFDPAHSSGICSVISGQAHCIIGTLGPNAVYDFNMSFTIPEAFKKDQCPAEILNTATVYTTTKETDLFNNTSSTTAPLPCVQTDLRIEKSAPTGLSNDDDAPFDYIITVTNTSQVLAENVRVTDIVPAPLQIVSASGCTIAGQSVTCSHASLAGGASKEFKISVKAPSRSVCLQTVTNTATVTTTTQEIDLQNNSATAHTGFVCSIQQTDLTVTKTAPQTLSNDSASTFNYTITAINNTPVPASNVVITDVIPAGLTVTSAPGCIVNGQNLSCSVGSLAGNGTRQFIVTVTAAARTVCDQSHTNTAVVTTSTPETNQQNNQGSATTNFTCTVQNTDLTIQKTAPQTLSNDITSAFNYALTTTNLTSIPAQNVIITDTIPSGLTLTTASPGCSINGNTVTCSLGTLNGNGVATITIGVSAPARTVCDQSRINTATVTTSTSEANQQNNQSSATTNFTCTQQRQTDVSVTQTAPQTLSNDTPSTFNYVLTAINNTSVTAQDVIVTDPIPVGLTVTAAPGCTINGQNLTCTVGTLTGNATRQFAITVIAPARTLCDQSRTNTATITTSTPETNPNNNQASATTSFTCSQEQQTDIMVTKTAPSTLSNDSASSFNYTLTVSNLTSIAAQNVIITDTIPSGLSITSASQGCSINGNTVTCSLGTLNGNGVATITIGVSASARTVCDQSRTNTATITTSTPETNPNNNQASATTSFTCSQDPNADVAIAKTGPSSVQRGSTLTYTLTATNNGPSSASNVIIKDPYNTTELTYSSSSGATCSVVGSEVQCTVGTMTSGQTVTVSLVFNVKTVSGTCSQTSIQNTATITTGSTDPVSSNNTSQTITTTLTCNGGSVNDISVYKTDNRSTANVGESLRYSIILTNTSSQVVNSLLVTDPVPYGLTILTVSDGGTISGQQVRWTDISVPANSSRTLYIDVQVSSSTSNNTTLTNTVDVSGKQSTDVTLIYGNTVNPPPPYYPPITPPPYYPPVAPPPYYPPVTPPTYHPPVITPPPVYYPPTVNPPPPVYIPQPPPVYYPPTGTEGAEYYENTSDTATLTKFEPNRLPDDNRFSAVFYATMLALFAAGSAVASRMLAGGL